MDWRRQRASWAMKRSKPESPARRNSWHAASTSSDERPTARSDTPATSAGTGRGRPLPLLRQLLQRIAERGRHAAEGLLHAPQEDGPLL